MKDKVIEILMMPKNDESIKMLCDLCSIKEFQANNLIDEFKKIYETEVNMLEKGIDPSAYASQKQIIIKGLTSGEYAKPETIINDLRNEVIKILGLPITQENITHLSKLCNLSLENAKIYITNYQTLCNNERILLSRGEDTTSTYNQKMDIINNLSKIN